MRKVLLFVSMIICLTAFVACGNSGSDYIEVSIALPSGLKDSEVAVSINGKDYEDIVNAENSLSFTAQAQDEVVIDAVGYERVKFTAKRGENKRIVLKPNTNRIYFAFYYGSQLLSNEILYTFGGNDFSTYNQASHSVATGEYLMQCTVQGYLPFSETVNINKDGEVSIYLIKAEYMLIIRAEDEYGRTIPDMNFDVSGLTDTGNGSYTKILPNISCGVISPTHEHYTFVPQEYSQSRSNLIFVGVRKTYTLTVKAVDKGGSAITDIEFLMSGDKTLVNENGVFTALMDIEDVGSVGIIDAGGRIFQALSISFDRQNNQIIFYEQ